jgi:putative DNA primase/helicase
MGDYALKVPSSVLMMQRGERHPTEVAQLCGVRLAVANEVSEGEHWDEARVKELTGDMKLTARFMRQDFFQFDATHKFLIAANHRPQVRTMDHAMRRRLLLVPFHARFEGERRDPHMADKLQAEAQAILAWLIRGAVDWHESGLMVPTRVRAASDDYADAMDSLGLWIAECCDRSDPQRREGGKLLYDSYKAWKEARGEHAVSMTRWAEQMQSRGIQKVRDNGAKYCGITLTPDERYRLETGRTT